MSEWKSNEKHKASMRDQTSTSLNTSGIEGQAVCSPRQGNGTPINKINPEKSGSVKTIK
jgi:hypothetical protein